MPRTTSVELLVKNACSLVTVTDWGGKDVSLKTYCASGESSSLLAHGGILSCVEQPPIYIFFATKRDTKKGKQANAGLMATAMVNGLQTNYWKNLGTFPRGVCPPPFCMEDDWDSKIHLDKTIHNRRC